MKKKAGSRGVTARDPPPDKLRHASHGIQVATRCLRTLPAKLSYSKIFAAPSDFFSSILFLRQCAFRTRVVCFATMWDFLPLTCWLCRRRAISVDCLTNWLGESCALKWKQVCPYRKIDQFDFQDSLIFIINTEGSKSKRSRNRCRKL